MTTLINLESLSDVTGAEMGCHREGAYPDLDYKVEVDRASKET